MQLNLLYSINLDIAERSVCLLRSNIIQIILFLSLYVIQIKIPIAEGARTYFSYILPWFLIVPRGAYLIKIFGIPINKKFAPIGEIIIYLLSMFFFLMALYKKHFTINVIGIIINILIIVLIICIEIIEELLYVYIYKEVAEEDEENV